MSQVNLDETDKAILRQVLADPRTSIADLARDLGVQRDTAKYRLERLEKRGVIMQYHVIIDPDKLGLGVFMQVLVKTAPVSSETSADFVNALKEHKNVTHIERLVGKHDYALQMAAADITAFDQALDEIKRAGEGIVVDIELANIIDGAKINDFSGLV